MTARTSANGLHTPKWSILNNRFLTRTMTVWTSIDTRSWFTTSTMTVITFFMTMHFYFHRFTKGCIFKGNINIFAQVIAFLRALLLASTTKHASKNVAKDITKSASLTTETSKASLETTGASAASLFEGVVAELVILSFFSFVRQYFVSFVRFFKLCFCFLRIIFIYIWMVLACLFTEGLFDFILRGIFANP